MTTPGGRRVTLKLSYLMLVTAGVAVGLSLWGRGSDGDAWAWGLCGVFGGIALVGPFILWMDGRGDRRPVRAGRLLWITQGTATWLLWPPIMVNRWSGTSVAEVGRSNTAICYAYGTPLMALFMVLALTAGGWIRPRRKTKRKRKPLDILDRLGLIMGLGWACVGFYFLVMFWKEDLKL